MINNYQELLADFNDRGIPTDTPDFYDHPNFLEAEKNDPSYLENYAAFVALRPYSKEYLDHARTVITNMAHILYEHLKKNGRQGACIDMHSIFARMLEKENIWCACIKGACTMEFPVSSGKGNIHFYVIDDSVANVNSKAAHLWLFAPPFNVIDITIHEQGHTDDDKQYIPEIVLSENGSTSVAEIEDILCPRAVIECEQAGMPRNCFIEYFVPKIKNIQSVLPVKQINKENGSRLKYCPIAIHACEDPLEGITNMTFDGKTPFELYDKFIKGKI